jgi:hypothetical protein
MPLHFVDVTTEIVIGSPREAVARFAMDPDNASEWYVNIKRVEWKTPRPLRVGSQLAFIARFFGRELIYTYEIVELIDARRLVMRTAEGPFPMETTYEFETVSASSTRMRLRNRGSPSGFSKLLSPFISTGMRRANRRDLALLKEAVESPA